MHQISTKSFKLFIGFVFNNNKQIGNNACIISLILSLLVILLMHQCKADPELIPSESLELNYPQLIKNPIFITKKLQKHQLIVKKDSPLLRSRKRILPITITHDNNNDATITTNIDSDDRTESLQSTGSGSSSSFAESISSSLEPSFQNQDFITDRVKMNLECHPKSMLLNITFMENFRGLVSIGKNSYTLTKESNEEEECFIRGDGTKKYSLQIFHNKCFTKFDKKRGHFINHLFVRYHPTLETGGDYSKTLICKFGLKDFSV